jgi:hypothetical protein
MVKYRWWRSTKLSPMPHRIAFYPCCASDVEEPLTILSGIVDEVVFCDNNPKLASGWRGATTGINHPKASFRVGDARKVVGDLPVIDALFYRRDSEGEGGSRIFVLGDSFLSLVLKKFNPAGGLIITDGSNSRGGNFKKMCRRSGLEKLGWRFSAATDQPLMKPHGLLVVSVTVSEHQ